MACFDEVITDKFALYNGDSCEVLKTIPDNSVHLSVYSPPFRGLYHYSSSERDLSNARSTEEFFAHYSFIVKELFRSTIAGRTTAVHCCDIPSSNSGCDTIYDFPGDIIRMHQREGWDYTGRYTIWKEPLMVRNRTMAKNLAHKTVVEDSAYCALANADVLLTFRKPGKNPIPIAHPHGFDFYAGAEQMPAELLGFRGYKGKQTENKFSHWIWRRYASSVWSDIRVDRVLPFKDCGDPEDEKHMHPLQLDVIDRALQLWSNPGEVVLSPFAGVGSEVYAAVLSKRKGVGIELKKSYFRQLVKNAESAAAGIVASKSASSHVQATLFGDAGIAETVGEEEHEDA